jgi:hypothetical protein
MEHSTFAPAGTNNVWRRSLEIFGLVVAASAFLSGQQPAQKQPGHPAAQMNMRLAGSDDLQGRSAYQPTIVQQGTRWIAYVGHHAGTALNPMTGAVESNGTSVVDVTDPARPRYLKHIAGPSGSSGEAGGAQMVRVCTGGGSIGAAGRYYMLRSFASQAHQVWDVTDPANPSLLATLKAADGRDLRSTHKNEWDCSSGMAYLVGGDPDWLSRQHMIIYNLRNPASPVFVRNFGLVGTQPKANGGTDPGNVTLHGPIVRGNRVYMGWGTSGNGVLQILDNDKLLKGDPTPTDANLLYPQIGRYELGALGGAHTTFPVPGIEVPSFARFTKGKTRDIVVVVNESTGNGCEENPQMVYFVDVTTESEPNGVANFQVQDASGDFCLRGGRFGAHSTNERITSIYDKRMVFVAYFNAGVRALDIRDPWSPKEVGYYIPATTAKTDQRCLSSDGKNCKVAIQTNNVDVDDRGLIYIVDRANTGLHVLELTGPARTVANFPKS